MINDINNINKIYISNPLLKNISSYKLEDLIVFAEKQSIDLSGIKKQKKTIYQKIFNTIN